MARPRQDKTVANTTSKAKPGIRKRDKPDLRGWCYEDDTDDTDIGPWMSRRVEGETRKGNHKKHKEKSDPRAAPPFNKFLWSSKSMCKGIDNLAQFAQDSLHEFFLGNVQVRLKQVCGGNANTNTIKETDYLPVTASDTTRLTKSHTTRVGDISSKDTSPIVESQMNQSAKVKDSSSADTIPVAAVQECQETEVTRLKRLIAIARRYRQEASEKGQELEYTDVDNLYKSYISISSEVSDATGDSGVSLSSLKSHLADVDGIWALEYVNGESQNPSSVDLTLSNGDFINQPVKFSYTQADNNYGQSSLSQDKIVTILCENPFSEDPSVTNESTPFITTLRNYKTSQEDVEAIRPLVRSLRSAKGKTVKTSNKSPKSSSPGQSAISGESGPYGTKPDQKFTYSDNSSKDLSTGEAATRPTSTASFKVQRIKIIIPNNNPDLSVSQDIGTLLPASHPANIIFKKLKEKGINATSSSEEGESNQTQPKSRVSSAVFPIGDILPVVEASYRNAMPSKKYHDRESIIPDSTNITANDLLMHRGNRDALFTGERFYVVKHSERVLGPPPFRPMTIKTPLHRARDNSRKRMYGNTFAQETQGLYQKLIVAKNGVIDQRSEMTSGRRRPDARNLSVSRSAGNSRRWLGRPLGCTLTDTEFHEARASLSARLDHVSLRRSATEL